MPLRNSPAMTPELLEATRRNAHRSHGPRSPAGKGNVKMNALKHGIYAAPENEAAVMRALGEDPQEYEMLKGDLRLTYGPGDALFLKQTEDLTNLYWRQKRIERMQTGLMRRALREVEARQRDRELEMAAATFGASRLEMLELDLPEPADAGVRARLRLSYLELIRAQVLEVARTCVSGPRFVAASEGRAAELGEFVPPPEEPQTLESRSALPLAARLCTVLENLYRGRMGWRVVKISKLLRALEGSNATAEPEAALRRELQALLEEEIAGAQREFEAAEKENREDVALDRDACLAPVGPTWEMLLREQGALDRSIDRKVRIILAMRKDYTRLLGIVGRHPKNWPDHQEAQDLNELLGLDLPYEDTADEDLLEDGKLAEQSANVHEKKGSGSGKERG